MTTLSTRHNLSCRPLLTADVLRDLWLTDERQGQDWLETKWTLEPKKLCVPFQFLVYFLSKTIKLVFWLKFLFWPKAIYTPFVFPSMKKKIGGPWGNKCFLLLFFIPDIDTNIARQSLTRKKWPKIQPSLVSSDTNAGCAGRAPTYWRATDTRLAQD